MEAFNNFPCGFFSFSVFRQYSQAKFITHDALASGCLNTAFNGASTQALRPWDAQLQNTVGAVNLMVDRLKGDYEALALRMRKPWAAKDLEPWVETSKPKP